MSEPYNPLDKLNLARSIEAEILDRRLHPLSGLPKVIGAGVYIIYYFGDFAPYEAIASAHRADPRAGAIYVGKAIPEGARKGGMGADAASGRSLSTRLGQHRSSIRAAENLTLEDFSIRYLVVDDIWIPLGENMLIETLQPLWNRAIDGFGNNTPGGRRETQYRSPWDVLHPGRKFANRLAESPLTQAMLVERVNDYLAGRPLGRLPVEIEDQQAIEAALEELPPTEGGGGVSELQTLRIYQPLHRPSDRVNLSPRRTTMRVMVLVKATTESERGDLPDPGMFEAMGRFNDELTAAGILAPGGGDGLKPSSDGKRVAFDGAGRTVVDGPFAAIGELVAGYWLWTVRDMDEAVAWVKRCPNPMPGPSEIEIRPLYEMSDFAGI